MSRTMFLRSTGGCRIHRGAPRRSRRSGRLIAMVTLVVAFALMLTVSPPAQVHGDYDDDDGHSQPRRAAPSCCGAQAPAAPAPSLPVYGCAEEYLGLSSGVYWHDFWRTCRVFPIPTRCYGDLFEGEPWYKEEKYLCKEFGSCPWGECVDIDILLRSSTIGNLQPRYALTTEEFQKSDRDNKLMEVDEDGYAELTDRTSGQTYTFKLFAIVTKYDNERIKTRLIGVQLDPKEAANAGPKRRAYWSKHEPEIGKPSTGSDEHHWIDVELKTATPTNEDPFPKGSTERFHVTTVGPVRHDIQ